MKPAFWTSNDESAWRRKIGMPKKDDSRPPKERNVCLRRLQGLVEQRMLYFINEEKPNLQTQAERAPTWTPLPWICHNLEISHAHLSRLFRELLGLNVVQFYDKLKLTETKVVLAYIALIRTFVAAQFPIPYSLSANPYSGNGSKLFWRWLKQTHANPDFDRQALAREFDFPSAARFHCAFYFVANHTPREFENLVIRLALEDPQALEALIEHFTPQPATLESMGVTRLNIEHLFPPNPPTDLLYPIVLYKKPEPVKDPNIIDAVFTVLDHQRKSRRKKLPLLPEKTAHDIESGNYELRGQTRELRGQTRIK